MIRTILRLAAALGMGALFAYPASAQSTQVGTLSCDVNVGVGMILAQKQTMQCMFTSSKGGRAEPYYGRIEEVGVAIGEIGRGHLVWGVLAPAAGVPRGALAGTYVGLGAQATVGAGVGANVLVGGSGRAFSLQPLSIEGQTSGLNIAAGVTTLTLMKSPPE